MQIVKGIKFLKAYASGKSHINADLDLIMTMVNDLDKRRFKNNSFKK